MKTLRIEKNTVQIITREMSYHTEMYNTVFGTIMSTRRNGLDTEKVLWEFTSQEHVNAQIFAKPYL